MPGRFPAPHHRRQWQPPVKLAAAVVSSLLLLLLDTRYEGVGKGRQYLATVLYPLQWVANKPVEVYDYFSTMLQEQHELLRENRRLTAENARLTLEARQSGVRLRELSELKTLAGLQEHGLRATVTAEVVSGGKDPAANRIAVNKGSRHGVKTGDAAADEGGLLGQVMQVQPLSAEIHLLTETGTVVPVMVERTGVRTLVYGGGGTLLLRYFPTDADLRADDVLLTSGLDDVYPAGIPVARVLQAARDAGTPYYKVRLQPAAALQRSRYVLLLPQRPPQAAVSEAFTDAP